MTTKRNMTKLTRTTGRPAAWQPSALYQSARGVVVCLASLPEPGTRITQGHALGLEGGLRRDNSQIQI